MKAQSTQVGTSGGFQWHFCTRFCKRLANPNLGRPRLAPAEVLPLLGRTCHEHERAHGADTADGAQHGGPRLLAFGAGGCGKDAGWTVDPQPVAWATAVCARRPGSLPFPPPRRAWRPVKRARAQCAVQRQPPPSDFGRSGIPTRCSPALDIWTQPGTRHDYEDHDGGERQPYERAQ